MVICHLRFDDTNPETEDDEFVKSIQKDSKWLGYDWGRISTGHLIILIKCIHML